MHRYGLICSINATNTLKLSMVAYSILEFNIQRGFSYIKMLNGITITHRGGGGFYNYNGVYVFVVPINILKLI